MEENEITSPFVEDATTPDTGSTQPTAPAPDSARALLRARPLTVPSGTARRPRVTTAGTAATGPGSGDRLPPGLSFTEPLPHCVMILP